MASSSSRHIHLQNPSCGHSIFRSRPSHLHRISGDDQRPPASSLRYDEAFLRVTCAAEKDHHADSLFLLFVGLPVHRQESLFRWFALIFPASHYRIPLSTVCIDCCFDCYRRKVSPAAPHQFFLGPATTRGTPYRLSSSFTGKYSSSLSSSRLGSPQKLILAMARCCCSLLLAVEAMHLFSGELGCFRRPPLPPATVAMVAVGGDRCLHQFRLRSCVFRNPCTRCC